MVAEAIKNTRTGLERLQAAGTASVEFKKQHPEYSQIMSYYHSGRFDLRDLSNGSKGAPGNGTDMSDAVAVAEISRLGAEAFETSCDAILKGREDGTIRPGMDETELAVLLSVLVSSIVNVSPEIKCLMEYKGIAHEQFIDDARAFIYQNIRP